MHQKLAGIKIEIAHPYLQASKQTQFTTEQDFDNNSPGARQINLVNYQKKSLNIVKIKHLFICSLLP